MKKFFGLATLIAAALFVGCATAPQPLIKNGDTVAFLGDSITELGASNPNGYCNLVVRDLAARGVNVTPVFAGISGHKSNQMLERVERDVISHHPQVVFVSCGVNDVWHGANGVELPDYQRNMTELVDKLVASGAQVIILNSTLIGEDAAGENNVKLDKYNAFLAELAREKSLPIADLNGAMKAAIAAKVATGKSAGTLLTVDGVHMNDVGNKMMAEGALAAAGFDCAK